MAHVVQILNWVAWPELFSMSLLCVCKEVIKEQPSYRNLSATHGSHRNKGSSVYKVSAVMLQLLGKIFRLSLLYCHWDTFPDRIYQCKKKRLT
jgi:hypothetical protein